MLVGYARRSTERQDLAAQRAALLDLGWLLSGSMPIMG
jgi:DNA invertase Pin-like site-specific DNA recombinase